MQLALLSGMYRFAGRTALHGNGMTDEAEQESVIFWMMSIGVFQHFLLLMQPFQDVGSDQRGGNVSPS